MKHFILFLSFLIVSASLFAQIFNPKERVKTIGTNRTNSHIDQTIDKGFDSIEEEVQGIFKKKEKKSKKDSQKEEQESASGNENNAEEDGTNQKSKSRKEPKSEGLKAYSKFDFVPGEKVVASEDFSQDAVGDFPAKWNTNATAEVVTLSNKPGKWLKIGKVEGSFIPEFVKHIPENSTIEFDLVYNNWEKKYAYQRKLIVSLSNVDKAAKNMKDASVGEGAIFIFNGGFGNGNVELNQLGINGTYTDLSGNKDMDASINPDNNGKVFKISMWRQKTRLRVYVDEQKVFDMPRIFATDLKLNELRFFGFITNEDEEVFISNLRVAVGAPDTRNKLITEGKFVTTGITFDVGSANIKPSSYGILKEIGTTLTENPEVKVKIIGHTDSDGDAGKNLELSKNRAESVKNALSTEFAITADRLLTDGKGASQPAQPNTTPEGKANNRRVEFVKL